MENASSLIQLGKVMAPNISISIANIGSCVTLFSIQSETMQSKSRPLDDITNLMTNAVGAMKGVGDEVKAMGRSQAEKIVADLDLVGRDEFEVLKEQLFKSQDEITKLSKEVKSLKAALKKATAR